MMREIKKCEDQVNLVPDNPMAPYTQRDSPQSDSLQWDSPHRRDSPQRRMNLSLVVSITAILTLAVWNGYLTWKQNQLSQEITLLRLNLEEMELLLSAKASYDINMERHDSHTALDNDVGPDHKNSPNGRIQQDVLQRVKRDSAAAGAAAGVAAGVAAGAAADNVSAADHTVDSIPIKPKRKKNRKSTKLRAAHFVAHVDYDQFQEGNFTAYVNGDFGRIFNMWKPEPWTNRRLFRYNHTSGKVTVQLDGIYLIYGQVMFHGPSARKSFGIHINDEIVPFIESLSLQTRYSTGKSSRESDRHSLGAHYSQLNIVAVTSLKKGNQVFLKSLEFARSVIPRKYLTFWGLAKL